MHNIAASAEKHSANIATERRRSPVSGNTVTLVFPVFSLLLANSTTAQYAAPAEMPTSSPFVWQEGYIRDSQHWENPARNARQDTRKYLSAFFCSTNRRIAVGLQTRKLHKYLTAFNAIMEADFKAGLLPVYSAGFISMDKQFLTIGINGFIEGAEFLGIPITPCETYQMYAQSITRPIYEANKAARTKKLMFNCEFVPAEGLGVKNANWDKEDGYIVPRDVYNSYFYPVEDETCTILDKFILRPLFRLGTRCLVKHLGKEEAVYTLANWLFPFS